MAGEKPVEEPGRGYRGRDDIKIGIEIFNYISVARRGWSLWESLKIRLTMYKLRDTNR